MSANNTISRANFTADAGIYPPIPHVSVPSSPLVTSSSEHSTPTRPSSVIYFTRGAVNAPFFNTHHFRYSTCSICTASGENFPPYSR